MKNFKKIIVIALCLAFLSSAWSKLVHENPFFEINIMGISGEPLKNAQNRLKVNQKSITAHPPNAVKWHFYKSIPRQIKKAIHPFGYFKATIKTTLHQQNNKWVIDAYVYPGPRIKFTRVTIHIAGQGQYDPAFSTYLNKTALTPGTDFNSVTYEDTKDGLSNLANARGYFQAKFTKAQLIVNLQTYTSQVIIDFNTGPRYRFGKTYFSAVPIKLALLRRYIMYQYDEVYNDYMVEKTRQNLASSPFFQTVVITPEIKDTKDLLIPMRIKFFPRDQVIYTFGAGYGTDTGIRGLISVDLNWINSRGHSMNFLLRGSQNNSEAAAKYIIPGSQPAKDFYTIFGGLVYIDQVTGHAKNAQAGIGYQTTKAGWQIHPSLNYIVERSKSTNFPVRHVTTFANANVLYPQLYITRILAKPSLINPEAGYNVSLSIAAGSQLVNSKGSFSRYLFVSKFLYTFKYTHTRFLIRGSVGQISINNIINLPLSMRFYTGGDQSIRGFEYNSIGPGKDLAVGSVEIQQRIFGKFYLAGFVDAGNVSNTIYKSQLRVGSGPAIVYLTPIGAIEISVAKVLSPGKNGPWRLQFSMGTLI